MAFIASGVRPSPVFRLSNLPTDEQGFLLVNPNLQSVAHPEIFGAGDCIAMESRFLDKVGVYAVREGPILASNLLAALENAPMSTFHPQRSFQLIINLGDGRAITCWKSLAWDGKLSSRLKGCIDRRFMRRFQVSGETADRD
jgi:NADH dehydrogenase FAD-containing subunit